MGSQTMAPDGLRAGAAKVVITPPIGGRMQSGAPDRFAAGILDQLYARALVLDDGVTRLALVSVDVIGFEPESTARIRRLVAEATGIAGGQVMVCPSHTHSGPAVLWRTLDPCDRGLLGILEEQVAGAVMLAAGALRAAEMRLGEGLVPFAANRRVITADGVVMQPNYGGPVDRRARVLTIYPTGTAAAGGAPLGVIVHAVCHPTVLSTPSRLYSGDYPATAQAIIEHVYGEGDTVALFVQGCCGNVRPLVVAPGGQAFREGLAPDARRFGRVLGGQAIAAVEMATPLRATPLAAASRPVSLPLDAPPSAEELRHQKAAADLPRWAIAWTGRMLDILETRGSLPEAEEAEVQAFRIGDLLLVALPGEPFLELGLAIEDRLRQVAPSCTIMVAGYANNECGYLCTGQACAEGGYEPAQAFRFYGRPAPFAPAVERIIVEAGVELAGTLLGGAR